METSQQPEKLKMNRHILSDLIAWKTKPTRKPLILKGARQVGKTYCLKEFGKNHFSKTHYLNFERQESIREIFERDLVPQRILREISLYLEETISTQDLLIFDEIQHCPKALNSLKYFCEEMPEIPICAAGSLLGVHLSEESFPVGKVDFLNLYPMSFEEYLEAIGHLQLLEQPEMPLFAHDRLWDELKNYFVVGGLPEVVSIFIQNKNDLWFAFKQVRERQSDLILAYSADIAKHSGKENALHIERVFKSIPVQLARDISTGSAPKFKFTGIIPHLRGYSQLSGPIDWLVSAGLILRVPITHSAELPLSAYSKESEFKLYLMDVGLLGALSELSPKTILNYDYGTYKGYFAENFILQELVKLKISPIYCWREKTAEVEFVIESQGGVCPFEVKSGFNTQSKSLKMFLKKYHPKNAFLFNAMQFNKSSIKDSSNITKLPLYLISKIKRFFII